MFGGLKLAPLLTEIKVNIKSFKDDMEAAKAVGTAKAEEISKALSGTTKAGEQLAKVGGVLTKGLTVPIVGAGTAAVKLAMDFEDSMAKVSTIADTTKVPIGDLKKGIIELSSETGESATELNEALYEAISASVDTADAVDFLHITTMAAVGGFTDNTTAVNGLTTVLNSYGMEAEKAEEIANQMLITQNLGKTTFGELAASMGQVTPVAASLGVATEELFSSLAVTTAQGLGTSESITALKGAMSNIIKPTTEASEAAEALGIDFSVSALQSKGWIGFLQDLRNQLGQAAPEYAELADAVSEGTARLNEMEKAGQKNTEEYKNLKKEVDASTKSMEAIAQANDSTIGGFATMFGSVEGLNSVLMLTSEQGMQKYNEAMVEMGSNTTALRDAYDKMDEAPGRKMQKALNEIKNAGIEMGDNLLPIVSDVVDVVRDATKRFSQLSEEQQDNILKWAGIGAAAGPALSVLGKGITAFTSLSKMIGATSAALGVTGFSGALTAAGALLGPVAIGAAAVGTGIYAIHEQSQLMNRTVADSREELSGMEKILADLQGVEAKSRKELEELGIVHKEFSDTLSTEFQEAVKASTKKVEEFNVYLREIGFDDVITEEESQEFETRVSRMCDEVIQTIQSKRDESQSALKELFVANDQVVDEGEQKVLEILSKSSENQIKEVEELKSEILEIKGKAVEEGRDLNEQEIKDIEEKNARIRQIELESVGGTQEEIAYAKNEFLARIEKMDLDSASKLMQEKVKLRDEEIVQIKASYDTQIQMLKNSLEGKSFEERAAIETQIRALETDRDNKIKIQNDLYEEYLNIIEENNPKLLDEINEYNGEVLTLEEKKSREKLEIVKGEYADLGQITESGCYYMYNTVKGRYEQVAVVVDETTGDIVAMHNNTRNKTTAAWNEVGEAAKEMAEDEDAAFELIEGAHFEYNESSKTVVDSASGIEYALKDVEEQVDGTRTGIIDLNGTPIKIEVNKKDTIDALNEIRAAADAVIQPRLISYGTNQTFYAGSTGTKKKNGGGRGNGSAYNGLDNVPFDGFYAVLHKGERVLTAEENKSYSSKMEIDYSKMEQCMRTAVRELTLEIGSREFGRIIDDRLRERRLI